MAATEAPSAPRSVLSELADAAILSATFHFRVMASSTTVLVRGLAPGPAAAAGAHAESMLRHLEQCWSRFRPDSDISRLNAANGTPVNVHPDTILLVRTMLVAAGRTTGWWDPTLLGPLEIAGYAHGVDDDGRVDPSGLPHSGIPARPGIPGPRRPGLHDGLDSVTIDPNRATITLPPGLRLDPGGIGKGLAADLAVAELRALGATGALVSIGGDLRAAGTGPHLDAWPIEVEDPFDPAKCSAAVTVDDGGVATSSTLSRSWTVDGERRHHVIDPHTGRPSRTDIATCTVIAPTGWEAEVHATEAILLGSRAAVEHLRVAGVSGIVVDLDGHVTTTPDLSGGPS